MRQLRLVPNALGHHAVRVIRRSPPAAGAPGAPRQNAARRRPFRLRPEDSGGSALSRHCWKALSFINTAVPSLALGTAFVEDNFSMRSQGMVSG